MQWNGKMEKRLEKAGKKYKGKGGSSNFCNYAVHHAETHKVYFFLEERYPECILTRVRSTQQPVVR
jgi:hypothetical protein